MESDIMKEEVPYELIAKFLAGECSPQEQLQLREWQAADVQNSRMMQELTDEWQLTDKRWREPLVYPDRERVWNGISERIADSKRKYTRRFVLTVGAVAASLLLLLGISLNYLLKPDKGGAVVYSSVYSPVGTKMQLLLNDGTRVWLNSGSKLDYSRNYGHTDRMLKLTGEAFFDVVKSVKLKFVVQTGAVNIVVHGTAFNVRAYEADPNVAVSLVRGSVEVAAAESKESLVMLVPGERVVVNKSNLNHAVAKCDAGLDAIWRMDRLKFEDATITEVAERLSKWYGVNIVVTNSNRFQKYWFTVKDESLIEILSSMNRLHPIEYTIDGNRVEIKSK